MGRGGDRRARVRVACLAVPVVLGPQLIGGSPGWALSAIALFAVLALGVALAVTRRLPSFGAPDALIGFALLWTGLQCVPLPRGLMSWLSPERLRLREVEGLLETSDWVPLSLDPAQTWEEMVVWTAIAASYGLGRLVASRQGRRAAITVVAASGFVMALVAFGHALAAAERVYGLYAPGSSPRLVAPLVNANHLGGFLAFGTHLGVGLALSEQDRAHRVTLGALAALAGVGALLAVSRGAVFSLALGFCWIALVLWRRRGGGRRQVSRGAFLALGGLAALILGGGLYLGLDGLFRDFESGNYSKLQLAARSSELAFAFPWAGVGRGAFGAVFASVEGTTVRFVYPENILAQWTTEWGLPGALLLFLGLGRVVWRAAMSKQLDVAIAAGALGSLVAHDLVDYALEMPGIAVAAAALVGAFATARARVSAAAHRRRAWLSVTLVLGLVVAAMAPGLTQRRPASFVDALREGTPDAALVHRATRLHPLDPAIALWAGHAHDRTGNLVALAWYNRAMQLAPGWSSPHLLAADLLWRLGARSQAALELREAAQLEPRRSVPQACRYVEAESSVDIALRAAPLVDPQRVQFLDGVARCVPGTLAAGIDRRILEEAPTHSAAVLRVASRMARADRVAAIRHLRSHVQSAPDDADAAVMLARLLLDEDPTSTLTLIDHHPGTPRVVSLRAEAYARTGRIAEMHEELERLRGLARGEANDMASAWLLQGALEERLGNDGAALRAYERAHRLRPRDLEPLRAISAVCLRTGQLRRALRAHADACRLGSAPACEARDRLLERARPQGQRTLGEALPP